MSDKPKESKIWTQTRVKLLTHVWTMEKEKSAEKIAEMLSGPDHTFSANAVIGKVHRLKLPLRGEARPKTRGPRKKRDVSSRSDLPQDEAMKIKKN